MTTAHVTRRDDGLRILTLNREEWRNALDQAMRAELGAVTELAADAVARAVVVTGAGSAFCAQADSAARPAVPEVIDRFRRCPGKPSPTH